MSFSNSHMARGLLRVWLHDHIKEKFLWKSHYMIYREACQKAVEGLLQSVVHGPQTLQNRAHQSTVIFGDRGAG